MLKRKVLSDVLLLTISLTALVTIKAQERGEPDIAKYFKGYQGTFVLFDAGKQRYIRYNEKQAEKRLSPCSTFKILNSLIGLETGVIPDENYVIKWDGTKYPIESWNRDHTLKSAIANSAVWYYQELAARVGEERMKKYVEAVHYGNEDISGGIRKFWLETSLKISANEQIDFLYRLYKNELPFSERSIKIVKEITKLSETDDYVLRGKTGSGGDNGKGVLGWFVGYVVRNGNVYIFATNIEANDNASGRRAREITEAILKEMKLI